MAEGPGGEVLVYETPDGEVRVDVRLEQETVWLTQQQMGALFGRERSVIAKHIGNAHREGELDPGAACAKSAQVQTEGGRTVRARSTTGYPPDKQVRLNGAHHLFELRAVRRLRQ